MSKTHPERENSVQDQIAHLNQLEKLIPINKDIGKYGLKGEEMTAICSLFGNFDCDIDCDISPIIQLIVTVLRKRKAEKPGRLLRFKDLSEFVAKMTVDDEHGTFTKEILHEMMELKLIKVTRRERVSIKI